MSLAFRTRPILAAAAALALALVGCIVVPPESTTPTPAPVPTPRPVERPVDLIVNGGFEDPAINDGGWSTRGEVPGWRASEGPGLELQRGAAGNPASGAQLVELDSDASSAMYQDIVTTPGVRYELRYKFAARPGTAAIDNRLEVFWDGELVDALQAAGADGAVQWQDRVIIVEAHTAASRLELRDAGTSNGLGTYVDDVALFAVSDVAVAQ